MALDHALAMSDDNEIGYLVEIEITYPIELHDKFKQSLPCPENLTLKENGYLIISVR